MANNAPRTTSLPGEIAGKLAAVGTSNGFTHALAVRYHADAEATGRRLLIPQVAIIGNDVRSNMSPDIDSDSDRTNGNDANEDGEVNILDVIIDLQLSGGGTPNESQRILADLNRDGKVNVLGAVITFQHIVGLAPINGCGVTDTQSIGTVVITK
jgi:hypothetical protein